MGAWGEEVFQNDEAMDLIGNLHGGLVDAMEVACKEKNANELFALLEIYFSLPNLDHNVRETFSSYVPQLMSLTRDDGWRDPEARINVITRHVHKWAALLPPIESHE